ncbi:MAG: tripartite tricarboxylate transporter TctB family protein [Proteobacteria bacterium]|nr:tripartite tricarboxylate transporter TctB family protein [Pseudomonadota bacterium]
MADQNGEGKPEKKHLGGELVIPGLALAFTLYYFTTIIDVPWSAQVSAFFVGSILSVCVIIFAVRSLLMVRRGEADLGLGGLLAPASYIPKRLTLLGLTLGYIFFIQWGGFTLTSFIFLSLSMLTLNEGRRKGFILGLAASLSLGGWLLFVVAFETRFPEGPFELAVKGLF